MDGPYQAIILPASREEGKKLKKRSCYSSHSELPYLFQIRSVQSWWFSCWAEGIWVEEKRRAQCHQAVPIFRLQGFPQRKFALRGERIFSLFFVSLWNVSHQAYESVAREANYWLDVLFSRGVDMNDAELFDLIGENRSMSRKLEEYGGQVEETS